MSAVFASRSRVRALLLGAALVTTTLAGPAAWAHGGHRGPGGLEGPMMGMGMGPMAGPAMDDPARLDRRLDRMAEALKLQPAQREEIRRIAEAAGRDLAPLRDEARQLHAERQRLWAQPTLDEAALEALRQRQQALHERMSARMGQTQLAVGRVLTPAQRQQWAERQARHGEHRPGGHPGHGPAGHGRHG